MATKPHQVVTSDDINFVCDNVVAEGYVVQYTTGGHVKKSNNVGDKVAGIILENVVAGLHPTNISFGEETGTVDNAKNFSKNQTHVSGVVRLMRIGQIVTNAVSGSFSVGDIVKNMAGGLMRVGGGGQTVGHALSTKSSDGYVKIFVNIA